MDSKPGVGGGGTGGGGGGLGGGGWGGGGWGVGGGGGLLILMKHTGKTAVRGPPTEFFYLQYMLSEGISAIVILNLRTKKTSISVTRNIREAKVFNY